MRLEVLSAALVAFLAAVTNGQGRCFVPNGTNRHELTNIGTNVYEPCLRDGHTPDGRNGPASITMQRWRDILLWYTKRKAVKPGNNTAPAAELNGNEGKDFTSQRSPPPGYSGPPSELPTAPSQQPAELGGDSLSLRAAV
ncbi:hypothetical protein LX36DRAFT_668396 [Colletotrichum falcatum]|nr:hypothetical protein LX36DRAFT_668396 [Colletotrichum falcatum]